MICGEMLTSMAVRKVNARPISTNPTVYGRRNCRAVIATTDAISNRPMMTSSMIMISSPFNFSIYSF